jgi:hypothetical protein
MKDVLLLITGLDVYRGFLSRRQRPFWRTVGTIVLIIYIFLLAATSIEEVINQRNQYFPLAVLLLLGLFSRLLIFIKNNSAYILCQRCGWFGNLLDLRYFRGECPLCSCVDRFVFPEKVSIDKTHYFLANKVVYTYKFILHYGNTLTTLWNKRMLIWYNPGGAWWGSNVKIITPLYEKFHYLWRLVAILNILIALTPIIVFKLRYGYFL